MGGKGFSAPEPKGQGLLVVHVPPRVSFCFFQWVMWCLLFFPQALQAENIQGLKEGVVKITAQVNGQTRKGTGVIIQQKGGSLFIVTASHVVEGDANPFVHFFSQPNRQVPGKVLALEGGDPRGLAVLVVKEGIPKGVRVLSLHTQMIVESGMPLTVIGFPRMAGAPWAVTKGELVGRRGRDLVFSGAIDEGNSGGPVIMNEGVVGIVTESRTPFAYATPAVLTHYILESWGFRFGVQLRAEPATITLVYLDELIRRKGFHHPFDERANALPGSWLGNFEHAYEPRVHKGKRVVVDQATGLMWQQGGSKRALRMGIAEKEAWEYVNELNQQAFGGFTDWRLPTVEELASLMEPIGTNDGLFLSQVFDSTQRQCWTSDRIIKQEDRKNSFIVGPWEVLVDFERGRIFHRLYLEGPFGKAHVRAVRSLNETMVSDEQ